MTRLGAPEQNGFLRQKMEIQFEEEKKLGTTTFCHLTNSPNGRPFKEGGRMVGHQCHLVLLVKKVIAPTTAEMTQTNTETQKAKKNTIAGPKFAPPRSAAPGTCEGAVTM
jgi:hypothetical protein